jgi:SAM-dependent methyltransferase
MWADADRYEAFIGRWSRLVAREFLGWLQLGPGLRWLDVGSGAGGLSATILERAAPASVEGVDPSAGFVEHASAAVPGARFSVAGAENLPFEDSRFDAVVSGLVLNFVGDPAAGVAEMARVVRGGGIVAAYVWDYAEGMQLLRRFFDAASAVDPGAREQDEGLLFPICQPEALAAVFFGAGLEGVGGRAIEVPTRFRDFDDFWAPFLGRTGHAPAYLASLPEAEQEAIRERLRASLPANGDQSIELTARAWAVRGRRPE